MKLILVRHGETEENVNHIIQGQDGGKLTAKGVEQSKEVGKKLKEKYQIDMVYCSPLKRCVDTLNNILNEYPIDGPIFMCKLLEERDFGEYTGMESHLIDWDEFEKDGKAMGVESLSELDKRVNLFLEDLKLEEAKNVLVVSHNGPIKILISKLTGKNVDEITQIGNAEINEFDLL